MATELPGVAPQARLLNNVCATIEVLFWIPDHPLLLQSFTWQTHDLLPELPRVHRFLDFWEREIEAAIQSVSLSYAPIVRPSELRHAHGLFRLQ